MNKSLLPIFSALISMCFSSIEVRLASSEPLEREPFIEGDVDRVGNIFSQGQWDARGPFLQIERPGALSLRLRFSRISSSSEDYSLLLTGRDGRLVDFIPKARLDQRDSYWSRLIYGNFVRVQVRVQTDSSVGGPSITLAEIAYPGLGAAFSLPPDSDLEPMVNYRGNAALVSRGRAVAKLQFIVDSALKSCTGFLIDDTRFVTNDHCINRQEVCDSAIAIFGYELTEVGGLDPGEQFRCVKLLGHDATLDVSLLKLDGMPGTKWGQLEMNSRGVLKDEQAYIVQYPGGQPKSISRTRCFVTFVDSGVNFGHRCSTMPGSSGSPVLGSDLTVVGLHHLGFDPADSQWQVQNRATRIRNIVEWLGKL
jgi:V8-like Glu-specific endopeptidase